MGMLVFGVSVELGCIGFDVTYQIHTPGPQPHEWYPTETLDPQDVYWDLTHI